MVRPRANWSPPEVAKRRYDTGFFVAVLPEGQRADGATSEAAEVQWRTPAEALDRWRAGSDILLPPTWAQLDALAGDASTAEILPAERDLDPTHPAFSTAEGRRPLSCTACASHFHD